MTKITYKRHSTILFTDIKTFEKINFFMNEINIQEGSINLKPTNTMLVMLCMGAAFVKKSSCLVARIVLFNTTSLHLFIFRILEPYPSKDIGFDLTQVISH